MTAAAAGMLATSLVPSAHAAPAAQTLTSCGQDITTVSNEVYLDRDLDCSSGFRVLPGTGEGDDPLGRIVNIDLGGHRLLGNSTETAISGGPYFHTLNVRNGIIENWASAITLTGSASVTNVQLLNNTAHALGCGDGGCTATSSVIKNNVIGVFASDSSVVITNTAVTGNRVGIEVGGQFSEGNYSDNTFTGNEVAVRHLGFFHTVDARRNVFTGNGVGIAKMDDYGPAIITGNTFVANGDGLSLTTLGPDAASATVARNLAVRNKRYGIYAPGATNGGGNKAAGNGQPCVGVVCSTPKRLPRTVGGRFTSLSRP